jgi:transcriptional regulator with XRE-family HTH domain
MTTEPSKSIAQLVDDLFKKNLNSNGQEYSCQEVSKALGGELDPSYIAKVRRGVIKNPGREALRLLGSFFKVPGSYFYPELMEFEPSTEPTDPDDLLQRAFRSYGLSAEQQAQLKGIITALANKETRRSER